MEIPNCRLTHVHRNENPCEPIICGICSIIPIATYNVLSGKSELTIAQYGRNEKWYCLDCWIKKDLWKIST